MTATASPLVQASRHIAALFPAGSLADGEFIELRTFKGKTPGPRAFHRYSANAVCDALRLSARGFDIYVGVAPRRCPESDNITTCPHKARGGKDHIGRINWAFVEADVEKPYASIEEILARFDSLSIPPDLVVTSGGGAHGYWQLDEPTADFARVEKLTRALRKQLGHDPAIDVSRVLRVAGTVNYKYPALPVAAVVRWRRDAA